jgi:DNA-directed RNA polymerase specialized sigma24 family protein
MSPLSLRRYRAERLLRQEFEGLRGRVLASVRGRLRASGVSLDRGDIEACYAQAWQGLYMAVLEGQEISSPAGWLVLSTFRRAIEEHRARVRAHRGGELQPEIVGAAQHDFAAELDDRARLRQLFEGLRGRLDGREREAAALCYLQGLSRSEAAARMGVSEARMRKLMEGRGPSRPGVAGKVGALLDTIREGGWCEEQGSLMRALAYGVLDPEGERYRLALLHRSQCPACRAYVVSLRGLAAALPPVFLPSGLGAEILARAGEGAHAGGAAGGAGAGAGAGAPAGRGIGGAVSASGAAGTGGVAGGGWLLSGGPLSAKLAVGCLLALGAGAGCIALDGGHRAPAPPHARRSASRSSAGASARPSAGELLSDLADAARDTASAQPRLAATPALTPAAKASREFGPEQALASGAGGSAVSAAQQAPRARSASAGSEATDTGARSADGGSSSSEVSTSSGAQSSAPSSAADATAAEREFSPG